MTEPFIPEILEQTYVLISSIAVSYCVGYDREICQGLWFALVYLLLQEEPWIRLEAGRFHEAGGGIRTRCSGSQGIAIGMLGLPTLIAGMASTTGSGDWWRWFDASVSTAWVLATYLNSHALAWGWPSNHGQTAYVLEAPRLRHHLVTGVAAVAVGLQVSEALDSCTGAEPWGVITCCFFQLLPVGLAVPLYRLLMWQLPGSFTLGEGLLVCQAVCITSTAALKAMADMLVVGWEWKGRPSLLLSCKRLLHGPRRLDARGEPLPPLQADHTDFKKEQVELLMRFVLFLIFWILFLAAGAWALTRVLRSTAHWRRKDHAAALAVSMSLGSTFNPASLGPDAGTGILFGDASWLVAGPLASLCCLPLAVSIGAIAGLARWVLLDFLPGRPTARLGALAYWAVLLGTSLPLMYRAVRPTMPGAAAAAASGQRFFPHIVLRKAYHVLALAMFVPVLLLDPAMMQVSMAIALSVLIFAEVVRCCEVPLVSYRLEVFMSRFADERDSGPLYITHLALLSGIAMPMWLELGRGAMDGFVHSGEAAAPRAMGAACSSGFGAWPLAAAGSQGAKDSAGGSWIQGLVYCMTSLEMAWTAVSFSGLICLGLGDTAASVVGTLVGRTTVLQGSRKTVEGTLAAVAAMLAGGGVLLLCVCRPWQLYNTLHQATPNAPWLPYGDGLLQHPAMAATVAAVLWTGVTVGAALLEAVTMQLDNLVVPVYYAAHLLLVMGATRVV